MIAADAVPVMLAPDHFDEYQEAIIDGGGAITRGADARVLVWSKHGAPEQLRELLTTLPAVEWVQLPSAGVDNFMRADAIDQRRRFTSAKGAYAEPVAEHALALTLGLLRMLHARARANSWGTAAAKSLFRSRVTIVGAGGVARALSLLLRPFDVTLTACRRESEPVAFADRTIALDELVEVLPDSDVVIIAAPLSPQTKGLMDTRMLALMRSDAVLVNVGRGEIVVTDDLVQALALGQIAGAALDVTEPEPLPDGHPLWSEPRALITPHSADTEEMIVPLLAARITDNLRRFCSDDPLVGMVDPRVGY